jgi:hypothetical protein
MYSFPDAEFTSSTLGAEADNGQHCAYQHIQGFNATDACCLSNPTVVPQVRFTAEAHKGVHAAANF